MSSPLAASPSAEMLSVHDTYDDRYVIGTGLYQAQRKAANSFHTGH